MQQPELYIGNVANLADETGQISNADTKAFLANAGNQFADFAQRFIK